MTECKLGVPATDYNDYGCYCGLGGSGTPVDGIDECCMHHDNCYDKIDKSMTCPSLYTLPYLYSCSNHQPLCTENQDICKTALCQCDKTLVECWAKYDIPEDK
uniref:Phospholipase A2 n=1 Tax=Acrobeloides nanus TaxID=290746 RepID=A0A914DCM4_9BILA